MPQLIPFPGLRYATTSELARLAAPPYDVIDDVERERLEAMDDRNAVHLILPRDRTGGDRYAVAAQTLERWQADGTLRRDDTATLTVVRMRFPDVTGSMRTTVGVIGALRLPAGDDHAEILPHERTLPKAKSDRLELLRATRANLDPIWGLSLTPGLSSRLELDRPPDAWCQDGDCTHEAWVVSDRRRVNAICDAVRGAPIVLADGHHRFETAKRYRDERPASDLGADHVMAFVVELAEEQLCIQAIHRMIRLPGALDPRDALAGDFDIVDVGPNEPRTLASWEARAATEDAVWLVDARGIARLHPRPRAREATIASWPASVATTDAALVETVISPRLAGAEWEYRADAATVAELVGTRTADAALLLRPVSVAQTRAVAEAGARMPQKTTYFHPKPRTGFVFRTLD